MYRIKEKIKTIINNPMGYIIYNQIPSLILTIILKFIMNRYLPDNVSEQIISITVKVLNFTMKIIVKKFFNMKMKLIWLVFVYNFILILIVVLMKNSKLNEKHENKVYIGLDTKIVNKRFNYGGNVIKIPP